MDTNEPTLALISDDTFIVDGKRHPGLITVQRFEEDHIEITVQLLGQVDVAIEVILDTNDLVHIKHLLTSQDLADAIRPSESAAADYDCRTTQEHLESLERMISSLHKHQVMDARRVEKLDQRLAALETVVANMGIETRLSELERQIAQRMEASIRHAQRLAELEAWRQHCEEFDALLANVRSLSTG